MAVLSLYDEKSLEKLTHAQQEQAWDLERSIAWGQGIDLQKPLVPLDENALFFPGAGPEERLAISQMMGLIIAASIFEMEECLIRIKKESWNEVIRKYPVNPEFNDLGEQFYVEEEKHSAAFRRYVEKFAEALGVDFKTLMSVLPRIENTKTETLLRASAVSGGQSFWWIVATVEQQFLVLYQALKPFKKNLDPLYFELHEKHFEEEARHSPFPYLMVELLSTRGGMLQEVFKRTDLVVAQFVQTFWTLSSLGKIKDIQKLKGVHPFFDVLAAVYPKLESQPKTRVLWQFLTRTPYISSLVNLNSHGRILRFAEKTGALHVPFPDLEKVKLEDY